MTMVERPRRGSGATFQLCARSEGFEALPSKYNDMSELSLDVQPGVNTKNYELESK